MNPEVCYPFESEFVKASDSSTEIDNSDNERNQIELQEDEDNSNPPKRSRTDFRLKDNPNATDANPAASSHTQHHFVLLKSLPPVQAALCIEKIRNHILEYCSAQDLLELRHVSQEWLHYATNDTLLKWKTNIIYISKRFWNENSHSGGLNWSSWKLKPLQELTTLMDATGSRQFPCSKFKIVKDNRKMENFDAELDTFCSNYGYRITKLKLTFYYPTKCEESSDYYSTGNLCVHSANWILDFVSKIMEQASNLKKIEINLTEEDEYNLGQKACTLLDKTIVQSIESNNYRKLMNLKLKSFYISKNFGQAVFEWICRIAPNLKFLQVGDHFSLNFYLDPINRLYLLKLLFYTPNRVTPSIVRSRYHAAIKAIANLEGNLHLNRLVLFFEYIETDIAYWPEVVDNCNKILEKSRYSLKKLSWTRVGFLPGLKIPRMVNVKYAFLNEVYSDTNFFPLGTDLTETFPKLRTIEIPRLSGNAEIGRTNGEYFLHGCRKVCAPSVKVVIKAENPIDLQLFQWFFPNAKFLD